MKLHRGYLTFNHSIPDDLAKCPHGEGNRRPKRRARRPGALQLSIGNSELSVNCDLTLLSYNSLRVFVLDADERAG